MTRRKKRLIYGPVIFALAIFVEAISVQAFEVKEQRPEHRRLSVELDVVPMPPQQDFEQYVQELAASAQREVKDPNSKRDTDVAKDKPFKTLNPMVLFRW